MKSKLLSFLFIIVAFSFAYAANSNVSNSIIKQRPPKLPCPICQWKEYFTLDRLEITKEGIFIHLEEKTLKVRSIHHDDQGFYYLIKCPRTKPKPMPIKPCKDNMHIMKENETGEIVCYLDEEADPPPIPIDEE